MMGADLCKHPRESRGSRPAWLPLILSALAAPALVSAASAQQSESGGSVAHLPHDLSPWGMFMSADIVVQGVMIGLFIASVVTWTVGLAKSLELIIANRRLREALRRISAEGSLLGALNRLEGGRGLARTMLETAVSEVRLSGSAPDAAGVKERVASHLTRIEAGAGRAIARGTGVLATIGSTAPFVGLFGTVWGIMNSFIGISKAQTTNLAVCLLYTSPSPRDRTRSRMPSSA